ncbi:MAG: hypothetical protein MJ229_07540 [bacterium]|nr:hypothetical protein [bacterium]
MKKYLTLSILLIFAFLGQIAYGEEKTENTQQSQNQQEKMTPDYENQDVSERIWETEGSQYIYDNYGSQYSSQYIGDPSDYYSHFGGDAFDTGY